MYFTQTRPALCHAQINSKTSLQINSVARTLGPSRSSAVAAVSHGGSKTQGAAEACPPRPSPGGTRARLGDGPDRGQNGRLILLPADRKQKKDLPPPPEGARDAASSAFSLADSGRAPPPAGVGPDAKFPGPLRAACMPTARWDREQDKRALVFSAFPPLGGSPATMSLSRIAASLSWRGSPLFSISARIEFT